MHYLVGDLQGCCDAFERLLAQTGFSASRDRMTILGDLVNRGPQSLATLRRLRSLEGAIDCLLGNHDLHLLAVSHGARKSGRRDTIAEILAAPDRDALLDWLRRQPLALQTQGWLCVHAGVVPQWDAAATLACAAEVHAVLRDDSPGRLDAFFATMYGDEPRRWDDALAGDARLRFIVNVLTRIRFVDAEGTLELETSDGAEGAPPGHVPWFDAPQRRSAGTPIAFGHWSTLGLIDRADLLALDTGCVWGGRLSAMRVDGGRRELVQVDCAQAADPHAGKPPRG